MARRATRSEALRCSHRREDERQRRRGEEVLDLQRDRRADALVALPALEAAAALEEGDALPRGVAGGGHAHRVERAGVEVLLDFFGGDVLFQQVAQGRVVEQRDRVAAREQHRRREPARTALHDVPGVGAVDVMAVHALPERQQPRHPTGEVVGRGREAGDVDRAGRGTGEDRKRARGRRDVAHRLGAPFGGRRALFAGEHRPRPRLHPAEGRDVAARSPSDERCSCLAERWRLPRRARSC